jgi:peptidoglycan/LPS O-acetylase OafA/YrhL
MTWCFQAHASLHDRKGRAMGMMRLLLAMAVVLSHADLRVFQLNPGVTAVVGFYLISGYVMAGLVHRHYDKPARMPYFYLDRLLRLYPQYLVYAGAALAWHLWTQTPTLFLRHAPTWQDIANNLLIVPLNFYMFNGSDAYALVPPGWSLGAELQFYLLAPAMLLWPRVGLALGGRVAGCPCPGPARRHPYRLVRLPAAAGHPVGVWRGHADVPLAPQPARPCPLAGLGRAAGGAGAVWLPAPARAARPALSPGGHPGLGDCHSRSALAGHAAPGGLGRPGGGSVLWRVPQPFPADLAFVPAAWAHPLQWLVLLLCSLVLSYITQRLVEKPVLAWRRHLRKPAA